MDSLNKHLAKGNSFTWLLLVPSPSYSVPPMLYSGWHIATELLQKSNSVTKKPKKQNKRINANCWNEKKLLRVLGLKQKILGGLCASGCSVGDLFGKSQSSV